MYLLIFALATFTCVFVGALLGQYDPETKTLRATLKRNHSDGDRMDTPLDGIVRVSVGAMREALMRLGGT